MKVLYITVPSFFDLEISLIREMGKVCDITVLLIVSPTSMHSSAFSINKLHKDCTLIRADKYAEMNKYEHLIDLRSWIVANNPDNSLRSCYFLAQEIKKHIKENNFDIIHSTTNCKTSLFLLPTIWKFRNTLYTAHDPIPHKKKSFIGNILKNDLYLLCYRNILLLSDSLEAEFVERNRHKFKKIFHSGLGVYDFLTSFPIDKNRFGKYILFFGRIDQYKGVDLLISAYDKTEAFNNGIKLVIAGRTTPGYMINQDNKNVVFLNKYLENVELANLIYHSFFVVLPYRTATQSGCVFSAFAFNKPVLATRVGDLPKQVNDKTGCIIPPNDEQAIKMGIDYMMHAPLSDMSKNIEERYKSNGLNSWKSIAINYVDNYRKILNNE
jgi:glycosyltransferase involved in cell wall biosynthesis